MIGHAVRTAQSEEGRKLIARARRVATGPEGRRLIEEAKRVGKTAGQAATSAENRARLDTLRERLRAPKP
jgi:DNA-binding transcriptional LysR family regulator